MNNGGQVVQWMDFIFDDVVGPILAMPDEDAMRRGTRLGSPDSDVFVMEDSTGTIQETGQEQRPARMVGQPAKCFSSRLGTDAEHQFGAVRAEVLRLREKR